MLSSVRSDLLHSFKKGSREKVDVAGGDASTLQLLDRREALVVTSRSTESGYNTLFDTATVSKTLFDTIYVDTFDTDPHFANDSSETALMIAAREGKLDMLEDKNPKARMYKIDQEWEAK